MKKKKCPKCGQWIIVPDYVVDVVHHCKESDGTLKKSRNQKDHPGNFLQDISEPEWNLKGMNPDMPDKKMDEDDLKKAVRGEKEPVVKYIKFK